MEPIIIDKWNQGMSPSTNALFNDMVNVDIHTRNDVLSLDRGFFVDLSDNTLIYQHLAHDDFNNYLAAVDNAGNIYRADDGLTGAVPVEVAFADNDIDFGGPAGALVYFGGQELVAVRSGGVTATFDGSHNWYISPQPNVATTTTLAFDTTAGGFSVGSTGNHSPNIIMSSGVWYVASVSKTSGNNGTDILSLDSAAGQNFASDTPASWVLSDSALEGPLNQRITALAEWKGDLVFATENGSVYPWDTIAASFDIAIVEGRNTAVGLAVLDNLLYALSANFTELYVTNGSTTTTVAELWKFNSNQDARNNYLDMETGNALRAHNNALYMGVGSSTNTDAKAGIWKYKNGALTRQTLASLETGQNNDIEIYDFMIKATSRFTIPTVEQIILCRKDDSQANAYAIEVQSREYRYTQGWVETGFYKVGDYDQNRQFESVELTLLKNLATDQSVKISYRFIEDGAYTEVVDFNFTSHGAVRNIKFPAHIPRTNQIQFKIELGTGTNSTTTPELLDVIIR